MKKLLSTFLLNTIVLYALANTYYVSVSGNDANSGTSSGSAWQTVSKVNTFVFAAGDIVAFEGGSTFSGSIYNPTFSNGVPGSPITLTSYGTGKATISSGIEGGMYVYDHGNITISNLIFKGSGYKISGLWTAGIDFYIDSITATHNSDNIILDNLECSGYGNFGIQLYTGSPNYGFNHVTVTNCLLHDNGYGGFQINGYFNHLTQSIRFSNTEIYLGYNKAYNNHGRFEYKEDWSGSGIYVGGTINGLIEHCEAYNNGKENGSTYAGPVGIFLGDSKFITIKNCISHHNLGGQGHRDGGGFDLDQGSYGCIIEDCESYENEGAGYGLYQAPTQNVWSNNIVRNNTSRNDGRNYAIYGAITFWGVTSSYRVTNAEVYGNEVYMDKTGFGLVFLNNNLTNVVLDNNLFCQEPPSKYTRIDVATPIPSNATVTNSTFPCTVQPQAPCVPVTPGIISGPAAICTYINGPAATYSIASVPNTIGYNWTVPAGGTITSPLPHTNSITVSYASSFIPGNLSVQALGSCGNSAFKTLAINKSIPGLPTTISGVTNVCSNIGGAPLTYSVTPVVNATSYKWTVPTGAVINSTPPFTSSISVSFSASFVSGNIVVQSVNDCGSSSGRTLALVKTPATPVAISGPTNVCSNIQGGTAVNYSIAAVPNASGYHWTVPAGATIISSPPYNTTVSVSFSNAFVSGNVAVRAQGPCGNSAFKSLAVSKGIPATPGTITGSTNVCANIGGNAVTYSIAAVTNATGYMWTVPAGATIASSQPYSTSISVNYSNAFVSGNVSVQALSLCGNSAFKTLAISKGPATPGTITGPANVCPYIVGGTAATYSIATVANATGYHWTVPAGATILSSPPYNTSVSVSFSNAFVSGNVAVQALGTCTNSAFKTLAISKVIPGTPGTITGPANVCANIGGAAVSYSIAAVTNATGYTWTVPAGATITSSQPYSTSISVSFSNAFVSGNVAVQALGLCGNSAFKSLAISKVPALPGTITGPANVCPYIVGGTAATYSIATVANATGYNWTVPAGATITSVPPFTNSITVAFSNSFVSGNVAVQALSSCGNSAFKTLALNKGIPATPGTITGPSFVCSYVGGASVSYSITAVSNATGYNWIVPVGAAITSSPPYTNSITVSYSNSFVSGNVSVQALGACGNSALKTLAVTKLSAMPASITGITFSCKYVGVPVTYSTSPVLNASSYTWTVPAGAIINGSSTGPGISVTYPSAVAGSVTVKSNTGCGSSIAKTLTVSTVATPISISGASSICPSQNQSYTVNDTANAAAAIFTWTPPTGITIVSGQGTKTVTVLVGSTFVSGSLSVKATACSITGSARTLALTKSANCPAAIISQNLPPELPGTALKIYPNPNKGDFILSFNSPGTKAPLKIEILTVTGQVISQRTVDNYNGSIQVNISERNLANGIYFVKCKSGKINQTTRLIVQR